MGEKADLQGRRLCVVLFVLFFMYWTGERYLNLGTAKKGSLNLKHGLKNMMFWERFCFRLHGGWEPKYVLEIHVV